MLKSCRKTKGNKMINEKNKDIIWSDNPIIQQCFSILYKADTVVEKCGENAPYYVVKFDAGRRYFNVNADYLLIKTDKHFYAGVYYYDEKYATLSFGDGVKLYQKCKEVYENREKARASAFRQEQHRMECVQASLQYLSYVSNKQNGLLSRLINNFRQK